MARAQNTYSRIVAWIKIILPLSALGLLSTLFLFSRTVDPTLSVPSSQIDLEQRAQDLGARTRDKRKKINNKKKKKQK